jgi:hypothetical protein
MGALSLYPPLPPCRCVVVHRRLSWMHWEYKAFVRKTGWSFGLYNGDGSLNQGEVTLFNSSHRVQVAKYARTYAQAVAGTTILFSFNVTTGFVSSWLLLFSSKASVS